MRTFLVLASLSLTGCDPDGEGGPPAYSLYPSSLDLGAYGYWDETAPSGWLAVEAIDTPLYITPVSLDGEGAEYMSLGDFADYTTVEVDSGTSITVQLDVSGWVAGSYEPTLALEIGALASDRVFDEDAWSAATEVVPVTFELRCDQDEDGLDAELCGGTDCDDADATVSEGC